MKKIKQWWLPDDEEHLVEHIETPSIKNRGFDYQTEQRDYSLAVVNKYEKRRRLAIDIGAHVGLWACDISERFENVIAFEPVAKFRECLEQNLKDRQITNVNIVPMALGPKANERVTLDVEDGNSGATHIKTYDKDDGYHVEMRTLDSFGYKNVDYIKIDSEGYEWQILKGAEWTLNDSKPIVILENKDKHNTRYNYVFKNLRQWMNNLGYVVENVINSEVIFVHSQIPQRVIGKNIQYADSRSNNS